jgi:hypothetical protein
MDFKYTLLLYYYYSRLKPFPSLAANIVGDCKAMQNVAALEIDPRGWLWVADSGNVIAIEITFNYKQAYMLLILIKG